MALHPPPLDHCGEHDHQGGLLLPHHVPEVDAGGGEGTLGGDVPVDDAAAGHLHHHVVGVDVVSSGARGQYHSGAVVWRDIFVPVTSNI